MAFDYVKCLTGCYSLSFLEKFYRASLPQWVGWYNPYDRSFSYEYYNQEQDAYVRRVIPRKIPNVQEFGILDLDLASPHSDEGIVVYRQNNTINWLRFQFGYGTADRDDTILEGPFNYNYTGVSGHTSIYNPYYLYVHDIPYFFEGKKITYVFVTDGYLRVFYFWNDDPSSLFEIDMTLVDGWMDAQPLHNCADMRISKSAFINMGKHGIYYYPNSTELPNYNYYHIFNITTSFDSLHNRLRFKSNVPSVVYYVDGTRIPVPGFDPFIMLSDRVVEDNHMFFDGYIDTSTFIDGTVTHKGYETDLEWVTGLTSITIEAGGFAFILNI